ncbi:MAG: stage II sporulation protein R [Clostridia bacterium]|nr:stage II sporulation protein R [Clostridia bacterium]
MRKFFVYKKTVICSLLVALFLGNFIGTMANAGEIKNEFVRFHIIANSNDENDQTVKWEIRNEIFSQLDLSGITSKEMALVYFNEHQTEIEEIANEILAANNMPYRCMVTVGKKAFPVREYTGFVLPAGIYDAISVTLGEGNGENFFCVMYPSLCALEGVTEQTNAQQEILHHVLSEKEAAFITGNKKQLVCKFKILEFFESIF